MTEKTFTEELSELVKQSIAERGLEKSLQDTIANQYVIEQVQTEFHCIINALLGILIENNIIDEQKLTIAIDERVKQQEEFLRQSLLEQSKGLDEQLEEAKNA